MDPGWTQVGPGGTPERNDVLTCLNEAITRAFEHLKEEELDSDDADDDMDGSSIEEMLR